MKLNNKGFSLTEILVSLGLFGLVGVAGMQIMSNNTRSVKTIQTSTEFNSSYSQINQNFLNAAACKNTLGTTDIRTAQIDDIKNRLGNIVYDKVNPFGNNTLILSEIEVKGSQNIGLNTFKSIEDSFDKKPIPTGELGYAEISLEVLFEKLPRNVYGGKTLKRIFVLRVEADENYVITKCFSSLNDAVETTREQVCNDHGGVYSNITGCRLSGGPAVGSKVKESACEMFGGVYSSTTGKCNSPFFSMTCPPTEYLEAFDLVAGTKVCKPLPIAAPTVCSAIAATTTPDGIDNNCNGTIDEKSCPSGYTAVNASTCERVYTKPAALGCAPGHRLGSFLGTDYSWDVNSCYKSKNSFICTDTTQYWKDADGFGYCELKRKVQVSRPCPASFPNGAYSSNYCYISYAPMKGVATCSGAPNEKISTGLSGMGTCYNITPKAAVPSCTSTYTFNVATNLCERTTTMPMVYN